MLGKSFFVCGFLRLPIMLFPISLPIFSNTAFRASSLTWRETYNLLFLYLFKINSPHQVDLQTEENKPWPGEQWELFSSTHPAGMNALLCQQWEPWGYGLGKSWLKKLFSAVNPPKRGRFLQGPSRQFQVLPTMSNIPLAILIRRLMYSEAFAAVLTLSCSSHCSWLSFSSASRLFSTAASLIVSLT